MLCCSVPEPAGAAAGGPRLCEVRRRDPSQVRLRPGRQDIVQVQYSMVQISTVQYSTGAEERMDGGTRCGEVVLLNTRF